MLRRIALAAALALLLLLGLAACGGDDEAAPPTTTPAPAAPPPPPPPPAPAPPAAPAVTTIRIVVEGGRPRGGIQRPTIAKGEKVVIVVRADAGEEVHLHGYDLEAPVTPGTPTRLRFTATIPGRFELELHHPDAVLADITVEP